jgi:hypothetical protein
MSAEDFDTLLKMVNRWKALLLLISVPLPVLSSFSSGYGWHVHFLLCPALNLSHEIFPLFCVLFVLHHSVDAGYVYIYIYIFIYFLKIFWWLFYMTYFTKVCKWTLCSTECVPHMHCPDSCPMTEHPSRIHRSRDEEHFVWLACEPWYYFFLYTQGAEFRELC